MPQKYSSYILYIVLIGFLSSCSALRSTKSSPSTAATHPNPRFINGIEVTPGMTTTQIKHLEREARRTEKIEAQQSKVDLGSLRAGNATALQAKYCVLLDVPIETMTVDDGLLQEVDEWWGTPYRMGGNSKSGIDCSAFSQTVLQDIYATSIPRTAQQQYDNCAHPDEGEQLQKGDLVFFGSSRHNITHVGVYITNNKFVHASTSHGVMISDLNDIYWGKRYIGSGRYRLSNTASVDN